MKNTQLTKTAVIYARYSSERQTEQSIEGQIRECTEYAKRHDILIVDTYIDRAMTGTNDNRTAFQKMLKDCSTQAWDIVLVYKLDRFSRNKYEMAMHRKTLRDNGIKLVSAKENIPDSPEGIILESLLEGMAEYYSAELSQKVLRGMRESRIKGNYTGGFLLFGYKVENKKILIDEAQAPIAKRIFQEYESGKCITEIIDRLTAEGIFHRGKPFKKSTLNKMLQNKKYTGIVEHNGELFYNIYPQLISNELFDNVKKKMTANQYGKHLKDVCYLLKDKLICGYCGNIISSESGTSKTGKVMRYYKCSNRKINNNCKKKTIRKDLLENLVLDATLKLFEDKKTLNIIADKILERNALQRNDCSKIIILKKEQEQIKKGIANIITAIENGIVTDSTKLRLNELENNLKIVETNIIKEQTQDRIQLKKEDVLKFFNKAIKKEPKILIKNVINKIILYDDKIEIYYNYVNSKERPDEKNHQAFLFYEEFINLNIEFKNNHTKEKNIFLHAKYFA